MAGAHSSLILAKLNTPHIAALYATRITMKLLVKYTLVICVCVAASYYLTFFVLPSVTLINNTNSDIESVKITLPNSGLDFGKVYRQQQNTIHYSLKQNDGVYEYHIVKLDGVTLSGTCGYVTSNEFHKRVFVQVTEKEVVCSSGI